MTKNYTTLVAKIELDRLQSSLLLSLDKATDSELLALHFSHFLTFSHFTGSKLLAHHFEEHAQSGDLQLQNRRSSCLGSEGDSGQSSFSSARRSFIYFMQHVL
jgi:hypothetical protein